MNPSSHPRAALTPLLEQVADEALARGLVSIVELAGDVLGEISALDLEPFELALGASRGPRGAQRSVWGPAMSGQGVWDVLQTSVQQLLQRVRYFAAETLRRLPREPSDTEDLRDELDLCLDDDEVEGPPSPIRDVYEVRLESLFESVVVRAPHSIPPILAEIAALLDAMSREHEDRLQKLLDADLKWLLGELHEMSSRCARALETMCAVMVRGLTDAPVSEALPQYASAKERAARVRTWCTELRLASEPRWDPVAMASEGAGSAARERLLMLLDNAAQTREATWLRAADRLELQQLRGWLRMNPSPSIIEVSAAIEELRGWARRLRRINFRPVLIEHDRAVVSSALELLDRRVRGRPVFQVLKGIYGRDDELDSLLRDAARGGRIALEDLTAHLHRLQRTLALA